MSNDALPDVFAFLDHRAYLAAWFDAKKRAHKRFSHRAFARRAGQKSPSLLLHVIQGKRNLTESTRVAFADALELTGSAREAFFALIDLDQAPTDEARQAAWDRLSALRRFREARRIEDASFAYLSHWYIPAIRELAVSGDFQADPAWLAAALRPRITRRQARKALDTLVELGLLVPDPEAPDDAEPPRLVPAEASLTTAPQVAGLAVHNYHREMTERARESIEGAAPEERHLLGVTVPVAPHLVAELKEELNAFQARLLDLCDRTDADARQVYQINLQLFPLSEAPEER